MRGDGGGGVRVWGGGGSGLWVGGGRGKGSQGEFYKSLGCAQR